MTARQELHRLVRRLTDGECDRALDLLTRWWAGPRCPSCAEDDLDQVVWQNDEQGEYVTCHSCGFCWNPNHGRALTAERPQRNEEPMSDMSDIDWPNLTERELDLLARYGNTPEVVAAAQAEQARRQAEEARRRERDGVRRPGDEPAY